MARPWTLLATDAGAEGLNLHHSCRVVIHVELPWNPVRLEQRTGRVDRIGQARIVHAVHLIARGTGEMRILARLQSRIREARRDIAVSDPLRSPGRRDEGVDRREEVAGRHDAVTGRQGGNTVVDRGDVSVENEQTSLRAVLDLPDPGTIPQRETGTEIDEAEPPHGRQIVRLVEEAALETRRIYFSRAYRADEETSTARAVALARGATRVALRGRALLLVGLDLEDPCGRRIGHHVSALLVALSGNTAGRMASADVASWLESAAVTDAIANDRERTGWETASVRSHRLFWQAALARGHAIERAIRN